MTQRQGAAAVSKTSEIQRASESFSQTLDQFASHVTACCHVNQVFGSPVQVGDAVVIPVARVVAAFGAGAGAGAGSEPGESGRGGGGGGGAGFVVSPCGVFEIGTQGARFKPTRPSWGWVAVLGDLGAGFVRRWLLKPVQR